MIEILPLSLTREHKEIIKAVLYFDVFKYPLTEGELYENAAVTISERDFSGLLEQLFQNGLLRQASGFILTAERDQGDITNRLAGNVGASDIMPTAYEYSRRIAAFPFVEGICLSGALSKKYYDEKGDIDFFIITKPGRLWICRTLLILRYKLLPQHKKKFWCTNYFISSDDLTIPEKNIFTATELAYLIPTYNYGAYEKLAAANAWYKKKFPNKQPAPEINCVKGGSLLKTIAEKILGGGFGKWLDNTLLSLTLKHWRKRYADMASEDFELQFRARKNVSKRHTKGFQNKVLKAWEEKLCAYENRFNVSLR